MSVMLVGFVIACFVGGFSESASPTTRRGILTDRQDKVVGGYQVVLNNPNGGGILGTWAHVKDEYINAAEVGDVVEVIQGVMRKVD